MKTLSRSLFLLPLTLLAASCAVSHPPQPADNPNFVLPDIPREPLHEKNIPYPRLDAQTQIDHLGIQIARLERTVEELNQRLQTLEQQRNIKRPTTSASKPKAQRLDDRKLKMNYLANGGARRLKQTQPHKTSCAFIIRRKNTISATTSPLLWPF